MRYVGQEHAVTVRLSGGLIDSRDKDGIKAAFDAEHLQRYGTCAPGERAELVSLRATVIGRLPKPEPIELSEAAACLPDRVQSVYFRETGFVETPVFARSRLGRGSRVSGPALIEEHASTTVVQPGDHAAIDALGNIIISIGDRP
jgi:N-methylhydantoinase A